MNKEKREAKENQNTENIIDKLSPLEVKIIPYLKETIDKIDDLLGRFYGLDKAEVDLVKNYDSHIRRV